MTNSSKNQTSLKRILRNRNTNFEIDLIYLRLPENSHNLTKIPSQRSFAERSSVQILWVDSRGGERGEGRRRRAAAHADDAASLLRAANQASRQPPIRLRSMDA